MYLTIISLFFAKYKICYCNSLLPVCYLFYFLVYVYLISKVVDSVSDLFTLNFIEFGFNLKIASCNIYLPVALT